MASPLRIIPLTVLLLACTNTEKEPTTENDTVTTDTSTPSETDTADTGTIEDSLEFGDCGDGEINHPSEECDDGEANANVADACRTDCLLPTCGDGIQDSDESCDDGNLYNIDGCSDLCAIEDGVFESEPNDQPDLAIPLDINGSIEGALWEYDSDCYQFTFADNDYISLQINPEQEECSHLIALDVYQDGELVETDVSLDDSCTSLDPHQDAHARFLPATAETETTVCVSGMLGAAVEHYTLQWETFSDSCSLTDLELTEAEDPDADLMANNCEDDDDNDGILDVNDNCPLDFNNGPIEYLPTDGGFFRTWVLTPAFQVSGIPTSGCQALEDLLFLDEGDVSPSLTTTLLDYNEDPISWALYTSPIDRIDFNTIPTIGNVAAPREIFSGIWVYSDTTRSVDVKFGPDDGGKVWINGTLVGETTACQGATADKYTYPTSLNAGWNKVLIQVRDNGGGWGFYFRFAENGTPITDLQLSPIAGALFEDYQSDMDGDGVGDQCDLFE